MMKINRSLCWIGLLLLACNSPHDDQINDEKKFAEKDNLNERKGGFPLLKSMLLPSGETVEMLAFDSWKEFDALATELDAEVERYDDVFVGQNVKLTNEELDVLEERTGYDEQLPLDEFEKNIGFKNSLRKRYNAEQEKMLTQEDVTLVEDPNLTLSFYGGELSLVNKDQEVMVADTIYSFKDNGLITIFDKVAENLLLIRNQSDLKEGEGIGMRVFRGDCFRWDRTHKKDEYGTGKYVKRYVIIRSVPTYTKTRTLLEHFAKNKKGKWRKSRADLAVSVSAYLYENCGQKSVFRFKGMNAIKRKKSRDNTQVEWSSLGWYATIKGAVYGRFYYNGVITNYGIRE